MTGDSGAGIMPLMSRHILITPIALSALLSVFHPFERSLAVAQDTAARAAAVLDTARKAIGGSDHLSAVKTLQASGDIRRSMGEMQMEGEIELLVETPDKLRRNETIGMPGGAMMIRTEVLNGTEVWDDNSQRGGMGGHMQMVMRGPGGAEMDETRRKDLQRRMRRMELSRYMLAWLLATDAPVSYAGVAEAPDGRADVLEITAVEGPALRLFVDQATHMPLMIQWRGPQPRMMIRRGPGGPGPEQMARDAAAEGPPPEATFEMRFDDYRKIDGIQLPHQISRAMNGTVNEEWTVKSYKLNAPFKSSTFTK
jgi:hypothetical protein